MAEDDNYYVVESSLINRARELFKTDDDIDSISITVHRKCKDYSRYTIGNRNNTDDDKT